MNKRINYWVYPAVQIARKTKANLLNRILQQFSITEEELKGKCRVRNLVEARSIYAYLLHKQFNETSVSVAKELNRNHATILHLCNNVSGLMDVDRDFKERVYKFV